MAYKALYRTYRPATFKEVAGQKHIVRTLQNALSGNKVAHAYLFTGPRGTGKTSMAKLMAKALNCEEGIGQQCNVCANCLAINDGTHPDVIEIDAASNNGVDEVRDLIDKVKYAPIKGKFKIYIIDEVHMMTSGAFNALLKTLEEPPAHVVFILATTEPHKVIPTIISRCQRYDFSKVADIDIKQRMLDILKQEDIHYESRAIDAIIALADGGVRDALSLLDQVIAYSGDHLEENDILELFGLAGTKDKINLLYQIARGDVQGLLETLRQFTIQGVDIKRLVSDLLDILKDLLIYLKTNQPALMNKVTPEEADQLLQALDSQIVPDYIDALLKAQSDFRYVANIRSLIEVVFLKLSRHAKQIETPMVKKEGTKPISKETPSKEPSKEVPQETTKAEEEKDAPEEIVFAPVNGKSDTSINHVPKIPKPAMKQSEEAPKTTIFEELANIEQGQPNPSIDFSTIMVTPIATSGNKITIDDENIIKIMVSGLKDDKITLMNRWSELHLINADPDLGRYAALLTDGRPYVLCKQVLILEYDLQSLVDKINIVENQPVLQNIIKVLLNRAVLVYALPRSECMRLKKKYLELNQIKKLPDRKTLTINVEGYAL